MIYLWLFCSSTNASNSNRAVAMCIAIAMFAAQVDQCRGKDGPDSQATVFVLVQARDPPQTKEEAAARGGGAPCATGIAAAVAATAASANITTVPPQGVSGDNATRAGFTQRLLEAGYAEQRVGAGEMRHDTEGWRCLESSFHALQVRLSSHAGEQ